MGALTVANQIDDLARANALAWLTTQKGGSVDDVQNDSSYDLYDAGTNDFTRGQCDAVGTSWTIKSNAAGGTIATDATAAPFSPQSILRVCDGAVASQGVTAQSSTGKGLAQNRVLVGSIWFKGVAGASYRHRMTVTSTGAVTTTGTETVFNATGAWQLLIPVQLAVPAGQTGDKYGVDVFINGTRAESFRVAHCMLQNNIFFVSPYIATSGGTTSNRAQPVVSWPTNLLNRSQSWIAICFKVPYTPPIVAPPNLNLFYFGVDQAAAHSSVALGVTDNGAGGFTFGTQRNGNGKASATVNGLVKDQVVVVVMAWDAANIKISVNGAAFISAAAPVDLTSIPDTARLGNFRNDAFGAKVYWIMGGFGTLADADAATLFAQGTVDPGLGLLGAAAQTTFMAPFNTSLYNSYIDAPVTNDLAGATGLTAPGVSYIIGQGAQAAVGAFAGTGSTLCKGGGAETATGAFAGAGVVYDGGGFPFFADTLLSGGGTQYLKGSGEFDAMGTMTGEGRILRSPPAFSTGKLGIAQTGDIDFVRSEN